MLFESRIGAVTNEDAPVHLTNGENEVLPVRGNPFTNTILLVGAAHKQATLSCSVLRGRSGSGRCRIPLCLVGCNKEEPWMTWLIMQ